MGIDWGIALGAGAQSAVKTYDNLTSIERQELAIKKEKQEQEQEQAFQNSIKQQYTVKNPEGGVASGQAFDQGIKYETPDVQEAVKSQVSSLTPEQQQEVFRKLKGTSVDVRGQAIPTAAADMGTVQGGVPAAPTTKPGLDLGQVQVYKGKGGENLATTEGKARAPEQIMRGVMDDMYKSGNMAGYQKAAAVYKMAREVSMSDATDKIMEDARSKTEEFQDTLDKYGMVGAVDKLGSEFAKSGIKLSVVKGPGGKDTVAVLGPDGKPQQTFTSSAQVMDAFSDLMGKHTMNQLMKVPGHNPKDLMSMMKDKSQGTYYDKKGMLDEIIQPYQIQALQAQTNAANASAGASAASANSLGAPIGTDKDGAPIFQSKNGPVYGDKKPIDPKAEITPWTQQKGFTPQLSTQNVITKGADGKESIMPVQIVSSMGRDGVPVNKVYDMGGKEISDPTVIKQLGVKQEPKQLTESEKLLIPKWPEVLRDLGPKATLAQKIQAAKDLGIRPEVLGLPAQPETQSRLNGAPNVPVDQGGLGAPRSGNTPTANNPAAPKSAIPPAPPSAAPLPQRIAEAVNNPQAMATLAIEAKEQIPILQSKIENAKSVIPKLPAAQQATMQQQIVESERMLQLYQGVLQQRAARTGLPN